MKASGLIFGIGTSLVLGITAVFEKPPWSYIAAAILVGQAVMLRLLYATRDIDDDEIEEIIAATTLDHIDPFVTAIARTAADAVAVVREYDPDAAAALAARIGEEFSNWEQTR